MQCTVSVLGVDFKNTIALITFWFSQDPAGMFRNDLPPLAPKTFEAGFLGNPLSAPFLGKCQFHRQVVCFLHLRLTGEFSPDSAHQRLDVRIGDTSLHEIIHQGSHVFDEESAEHSRHDHLLAVVSEKMMGICIIVMCTASALIVHLIVIFPEFF